MPDTKRERLWNPPLCLLLMDAPPASKQAQPLDIQRDAVLMGGRQACLLERCKSLSFGEKPLPAPDTVFHGIPDKFPVGWKITAHEIRLFFAGKMHKNGTGMGHGMKILPAEIIQDLHVPSGFQEQGFFAFSGKPQKPHGGAFFHNDPDILRRIGSLRQLLHNLRGDKEGNVGKNFVAALLRQRIVQEIPENKLQIIQVGEFCPCIVEQLSVNLHGINRAAFPAERLCEMAFSGTDLQDGVSFGKPGKADDLPDQPSVCEEILRVGQVILIIVVWCSVFLHDLPPSNRRKLCSLQNIGRRTEIGRAHV